MAGTSIKKGKAGNKGELIIRFTVAEYGEIHSLGEYHEDIKTAKEAAAIYQNIPPERRHGIPAIGIKLHRRGQPPYEDIQIDILSGGEIHTGMLHYDPEAGSNPQVWKAVEKLERLFPEKEVVDF